MIDLFNIRLFSEFISNLKKDNLLENTDVILLPEMFNTAFSIKENRLAEKMDGKTIAWMKSVSKEKSCAIAGSLMINENNKIYNRLVWISKNGNIFTYDKYHMFSLIKEEIYITKGNNRLIVEEDGWKICTLICYDLRFPVFSRNNINYDVLVYLANWPSIRIDAWDTLLKARSIENQCFTIGVNRVGKDVEAGEYNGHSAIYDLYGKSLFFAKENIEQVETIVLDYQKLQKQRKKINFLKDRDSFLLPDLPGDF